mgnify:CR=1 FL=1
MPRQPRLLTVVVAALCFALAQPVAGQTRRSSQDMDRQVEKATEVKERHVSSLMALPAVVGAGVGVSKKDPGQAAIQVFVRRALTKKERRAFPKVLEGVPVEIVQSGEFRARTPRP